MTDVKALVEEARARWDAVRNETRGCGRDGAGDWRQPKSADDFETFCYRRFPEILAALEASPPASREGLTDAVWLELQRSIASSGEEAKRLVMMGKDDLAYAIGRAFDTLPVRMLLLRNDYARGFEAAREMAAKVADEEAAAAHDRETRYRSVAELTDNPEQEALANFDARLDVSVGVAAHAIASRISALKPGDAT